MYSKAWIYKNNVCVIFKHMLHFVTMYNSNLKAKQFLAFND